MSERYSTEAVACGLADVAGWLEDEGWIPKHVRQIRLGLGRLRKLEAENGRLLNAITTADLQIGDGHIENARRTLHVAMDGAALPHPTASEER